MFSWWKISSILKDRKRCRLANWGVASLTTVSLLDKPSRREVEVEADYVAFTIEDAYVIGYGLDDAGLFRNLPFVAVVDGD